MNIRAKELTKRRARAHTTPRLLLCSNCIHRKDSAVWLAALSPERAKSVEGERGYSRWKINGCLKALVFLEASISPDYGGRVKASRTRKRQHTWRLLLIHSNPALHQDRLSSRVAPHRFTHSDCSPFSIGATPACRHLSGGA